MHVQNFYFGTEGYNFHMNFVCGGGGGAGGGSKVLIHQTFLKTPTPWDVINDRSLAPPVFHADFSCIDLFG